MASAAGGPNKYLSKDFINGVYIPSGLVVFGVLIVKSEWLPYAVVLTALLAGFKVWSTRMCSLPVLLLDIGNVIEIGNKVLAEESIG